MATPKSLTDTFYLKANEGLLPSDDTQRLGADDVSRRIRASENEELLSHDSMAGLTLRGDKWARYNDDMRTRAQEGSKKDGGIDILLMHLLDEIQRIQDAIAANNARLEALERYDDALSTVIDALQNGGEVARNPDGSLADEDAEAAIREYEERYGTKVDRDDPAQLAKVLDSVRDETRFIQRDNDRLIDRHNKAKNAIPEEHRNNERYKALVYHAETLEEQHIADKALSEAADRDFVEAGVEGAGFEAETDDFVLSDGFGSGFGEEISLGSEKPVSSGEISRSFKLASAGDVELQDKVLEPNANALDINRGQG